MRFFKCVSDSYVVVNNGEILKVDDNGVVFRENGEEIDGIDVSMFDQLKDDFIEIESEAVQDKAIVCKDKLAKKEDSKEEVNRTERYILVNAHDIKLFNSETDAFKYLKNDETNIGVFYLCVPKSIIKITKKMEVDDVGC